MNSSTNREWFTAFELEKRGGCPVKQQILLESNYRKLEKKANKRKKGVVYEYHYSSLPPAVQRALGFTPSATTTKNQINKIKEPSASYNDDTVMVGKARLLTAMITLDEILEMTRKTMPAKARAQMVWMIYELLSEESANEKIINLVKMVA